jgi:hypothetical protein
MVVVSMHVPKHSLCLHMLSIPAVWEMVSREAPFAGLHVGEIIHRVVTEDMRPGK